MTTFLIILVCILTLLLGSAIALLVYVARKCMQYHEILENLQQQTDDFLEKLTIIYNNVHKKSQRDIFLDEPIVRDLMDDIKVTYNLIIVIADTFAKQFKNNVENDENDNNE